MVIQLDNGQSITIYEDNNLLKQIEPYIDKEIFDLLEEQYGDMDNLEFRNELLEDKIADQDEAYDSLEMDLDNLRDKYDDLYDEYSRLEKDKDKIISQIKKTIDKSRNNKLSITEIKNILEQIWGEN